MSISEKVQAAEQSVVEAKDTLVELTKSYESEETPEGLIAIEEQAESVEKATQQFETYRRAEQALAAKAVAVAPESAPAVIKSQGSVIKEPVDYLIANAVATFEAHITKQPFDALLESRFGGNEYVKAVSPFVTKATVNPAMTSVDGWAAELTREGYGQFMELLQPESIIPNLPLTTMDFGSNASIKIPGRATTPNMAGAFVGEGDPIPVKRAATMSQTLTPKKLGVIGTFTQELFERSTPNIMEAIRRWMLEDTAVALDNAFLSDFVGSPVQPQGMESLAGTPIDGTDMLTDQTAAIAALKAAIVSMTSNNMGRRPVWVMHPSVAFSLTMMHNAVGAPAFPEMGSGQLINIPVVTSTTCATDSIFLLDCADIVFAGSAPRFLASDVATIHEEDTTPLPLVDGADTVASPQRSLYQTYSSALRTTWYIDWASLRDGSVVLIKPVS
jgi:HK97 family phage major capsid protein